MQKGRREKALNDSKSMCVYSMYTLNILQPLLILSCTLGPLCHLNAKHAVC